MEIVLSMITTAFILIFVSSIYYYVHTPKDRYCGSNTKSPPRVRGSWPIIGHLHLLSGPQVLRQTLAAMVDKHGPIFTFKLGVLQVLVVSDSNLAKECFTINDKSFVNRPKSIGVELMGYNYAMFSLGVYGSYTRKVRKIIVNEILSRRQNEVLERIRVSGVTKSMNDIYIHWKKNKEEDSDMVRYEMKELFGKIVLNKVLKMVLGKRYSSADEQMKSQKVLGDFLVLLGTFVVGDAIPWLRWLDIGGYEKQMRNTFSELDYILQEALEEKKRSDTINENKDFMDVILSNLDGVSSEDLGGFDHDVVAKSTCLALFSGATDTTIVTLIWAIALLLNNKHSLKMVQEELDLHIGRERRVKESDTNNLIYLQAVLKETMRLYAPAPHLLPHESIEDCVVGGYHIPKGTLLLVNLYKIHRDPILWPDPSEFRPERFLTTHKNVDFKGQHFELIPFGSGRRKCPAISLATQDLLLILASLLHEFEITAVDSDVPIDMTEGFGLANHKATPLEVFLRPKLSQDLYK